MSTALVDRGPVAESEILAAVKNALPFISASLGPQSAGPHLKLRPARVGQIALLDLDTNVPVSARINARSNSLTLCILRTGKMKYQCGSGRSYKLEPGGMLIGQAEAGGEVHMPKGGSILVVNLPARTIADVLARRFSLTGFEPRFGKPALGDCREVNRIRQAVSMVTMLWSDKASRNPVVATELQDLLASLILLHTPSSLRKLLTRAAGSVSEATARRACDFMEAHLESTITIGDVARAASCSTRVLQLAFQRRYGVTPMRKLKQMRQRTVHARSGKRLDITHLALACGVSHPARFAPEARQPLLDLLLAAGHLSITLPPRSSSRCAQKSEANLVGAAISATHEPAWSRAIRGEIQQQCRQFAVPWLENPLPVPKQPEQV
jgi:AraC-like DNA-binding protein